MGLQTPNGFNLNSGKRIVVDPVTHRRSHAYRVIGRTTYRAVSPEPCGGAASVILRGRDPLPTPGGLHRTSAACAQAPALLGARAVEKRSTSRSENANSIRNIVHLPAGARSRGAFLSSPRARLGRRRLRALRRSKATSQLAQSISSL